MKLKKNFHGGGLKANLMLLIDLISQNARSLTLKNLTGGGD